MTTFYSTMDSPIGPFTAVTDADGAVLASGWTDDLETLLPLVHLGHRQEPEARGDLGVVTKAAVAYFDGDLAAIDSVEVRQRSGEFLMHAWDVLREVKPGKPVTYSEFARLAGRPAAVRGAASACARNAAALFVPCHRVLRLDGTLGGFRWGLPAKEWLLKHETQEAEGGKARETSHVR
jgi:methylated-DNA-[protein]-cysteine S-methyltransferase